ncbi:MAG: UDP-glucose 4-epimerase GalE [Aminipila sp.]
MNILVTGGAGYIGSHTANRLKEKGYTPIIYDNLSTGHRWAAKNCELVIGDVRDKEALLDVFSKHDIKGVIHFAASSLVGESVSNPSKYYDNNVIGSKCLLDSMIYKGIDNIVFSSTCATYGIPEAVPISEEEKQKPINTYGWTKLMIERILEDYGRAYGLSSIALRYFNAAGAGVKIGLGEAHTPETHVIPLLLQTVMGQREEFSLFGDNYDTFDGSCIRDYIHVEDLAEAHVLAMDRLLARNVENNSVRNSDTKRGSFQYFNLGTGKGVSVLELIREVEAVTNEKVNFTVCPKREGDPPILIADNSKAVKELGWKPIKSGIENIVSTAYEWAKAYMEKSV